MEKENKGFPNKEALTLWKIFEVDGNIVAGNELVHQLHPEKFKDNDIDLQK